MYNSSSNEVSITGIGTALPSHCESQVDITNYLLDHLSLSTAEKRRLKKVYLESGIEYRYSVIESLLDVLNYFDNAHLPSCLGTKERMEKYKKNALPLALNAIHNCFYPSSLETSTITHLITVSCTGMYAPGLDIEITHALGIPTTVQRTCINFMGCYGVFNALKCAEAICQANVQATVLIVSVELCSLHFQKLDSIDNLISSAIFSDGAGALLVQNTQNTKNITLNNKKTENPKETKQLMIKDFYCNILPKSHQEMTWDISNHGFDIVLSSYIPELINGGIREFIEGLFQRHSLAVNDCHHYAIHPGGKRILSACELALGLTPEKLSPSYEILKLFGNMSSATIIFVLKKIWDTLTRENHNETLYSCAFGPGLTLESMILKINYV